MGNNPPFADYTIHNWEITFMRKKLIATATLATLAASGVIARQTLPRALAKLLKLPPPRYAVGIEQGLTMTTPDGVTLIADHYYPKGWGEFPTLLRRTPYGRNAKLSAIGLFAAFCARTLAQRGYHVVMQDVRGRGESGGEFTPFENEAADGRATLAWISRQPWFNGALGLWGESYNGYTQWAVTTDAPAYLKAMVTSISSAYGYGYAYSPGGAFYLQSLLEWTSLLEGSRQMGTWWKKPPHKWRSSLTSEKQLQAAYDYLPASEADTTAFGQRVRYFGNWANRPAADDPYWQPMNYRASLSELAAPVHLIGGWYDIFTEATFRDYEILRAAGRNPYLTVGPWIHGLDATWTGVRQAIAWFDTHLKGEHGHLDRLPVRYYVIGADEWREAEAWPPPTKAITYFLHQYRQLCTDAPQGEQSPDVYRYDPADPTPSLAGNLLNAPNGVTDNRPLEVRPDVVSYTSSPLASDVEIVGNLHMVLYVRSSLAHADFFVRLCDVYPDGRSLNISDGFLRVNPSVGQPQPDGTLRLDMDMTPTAIRLAKAHCLRLIVASGAHPRFNRNTGHDEPIATTTRLEPSTQQIYHDTVHPSMLVLPIKID